MSAPEREFQAIAITGIAASCALGSNRFEALDAIASDKIGFSRGDALEQLPQQPISVGQAVEAEPIVGNTPDRAEQLLGRTIRSAMDDAGCPMEACPGRAVVLGTTLGGARHMGHALRSNDFSPFSRVNNGAVAFHTMQETDLPRGAVTLSGACASGLTTVINAALLIAAGDTDLAVAAGYDPISEFSLGGFKSLRLVASDRSMPFESDRSGMKIGEGYGAIVLEHPDRAIARGARIHAWLVGWGERSDSFHLTHPDPEGNGAAHALKETLARAGNGRTPQLIFAHATATPANDEAEYAAYSNVFKSRLPEIQVCAMKSRIGHALGGAGAVELVLGLTAMERGILPTTGPGETDRSIFPDIEVKRGMPEPGKLDRFSVLSLGFGGADACVLVDRNRPEEDELRNGSAKLAGHEAVITGIGALLPGVGRREGMHAGRDLQLVAGDVEEAALEGLDDARAIRRLSILARLARATARLAADNAGLEDELIAESNAIMATFHGPMPYTLGHYNAIIEHGVDLGNPLYFAESVPNIPSAQVSLAMGIQGSTNTIFGTRTSGLEALHFARLRIESGIADRVIVVAVEERDDIAQNVMDHFNLLDCPDGTREQIGAGAVGLVLERATGAQARGVKPLARVRESALDWPYATGLSAQVDCGRRLVARHSGARTCRITPSMGLIGRIERTIARTPRRTACENPELHSVSPFIPLLNAVDTQEPTLLVCCDFHGATAVVGIDPS